ncbi:MAG TPA: HD domain-containing phosphohydrolase [Candidatus Acidoferrum sp.]|nr:HD domain-containing phosphohydrolase [Candidatus Acidoferrum sp.]
MPINRVKQECFAPSRAGLTRYVAPFEDRSGEGDLAEGVLFSLAKVVELRDSHTAGHCERLAFTGVALGVALGLDSASLLTLYLGGYLHDVGKVGIPDAILFKPGNLTDEEWAVMRSHPVRGEEICYPLKSLRHVLPLIRSHHERLDGTGYPDRLVGDQIPLLARVLQTVDIYDALTNPRPYKPAFTRQRALEIMEEEMDKGWRDKEITSRFVRLNKRVLEKIDRYRSPASDTSMRDSFGNLRQFLAS